MGGAIKYFPKNVLGHEIFSSVVPWATNFFLKKIVKPSGPLSYILNLRSLTLD